MPSKAATIIERIIENRILKEIRAQITSFCFGLTIRSGVNSTSKKKSEYVEGIGARK
jgi:hypothetical protein